MIKIFIDQKNQKINSKLEFFKSLIYRCLKIAFQQNSKLLIIERGGGVILKYILIYVF